MKEVEQLLEDAMLVESVYDAQGRRHRKSRTHGRTQTQDRAFTRIGARRCRDAKTQATRCLAGLSLAGRW
jgi:hypothetical protein